MYLTKEDVLVIQDPADLRDTLDCRNYDARRITEIEISHILRVFNALWLHSGAPADPHAVLTSDNKHTNGFVDVLRAIRYTTICELLARELVKKIEDKQVELTRWATDWIIGSDHAAAAFSYAVAERMGAQHDFTEKGPDGTQLWKRFTIQPDEDVLQVEDLVTTTKTLQAVREGIREGNAEPVMFTQFVATLVHRSAIYEIERTPIIYLVHYDIDTWEPEQCPLCAAGSKPIREPKKNWAELTGKA